ncbi:MAG: peptidoglycan-binding domain-containing protein [bacterium]
MEETIKTKNNWLGSTVKKSVLIFALIIVFGFGNSVFAATVGENVKFNVDPNYDISGRKELSATLIKVSSRIQFFIDKNWWDAQTAAKKSEVFGLFDVLGQEFDQNAYPKLTSFLGSEWSPGIDGDSRIVALFHPMKEGMGGYFRSNDEYLKLQIPDSNEREMIYLTTKQMDINSLKVFLAHEFVHLITFNQKERKYDIPEETWLNEARAEYSATFLGYNDTYEGSNLQRRVNTFLEYLSDPITEWQGKRADYGGLDVFIHYLVDHYGEVILADSLKSEKIGIYSLNDALSRNKRNIDFGQIFTDWTIAVLINDCTVGPKYCYLNPNLKNLRITPSLNFLPVTGKSSLSVTNTIKNWEGSWQKIVGGKGVLKLEFSSLAGLNFRVPYLIKDAKGKYSVNFLVLNGTQKGEVYIPDFGTINQSLVIIPTLQTKNSGFDGGEPTYPFTFTASAAETTLAEEEELKIQLLAQIQFLQEQIAKLMAQIGMVSGSTAVSCDKIETPLYFGIRNSDKVRCLQEFLKSQGPSIYPERIISGNFLSLTQSAVIRFQEKYQEEILAPFGLNKGTGYVGKKTIEKINNLLGNN